MKTKILGLVVLFLMGTTSLFAQTKTEKFKVFGNCGMCEKRIEKATKSVEGVSSAYWDKKTQMIKVVFDKSKTNLDKIHHAIAKVGHDTDTVKADDKVYNKLPGCCQYRKK